MPTPVPITARVHYDDIQKEYRLVAAREDPESGAPFDVNEVIRLVETFATLVELVAFLLDFMSGISPTSTTGPASDAIGSWETLARYAATRAGGSFTP